MFQCSLEPLTNVLKQTWNTVNMSCNVMFYLISECSSSHLLQTQLITQSHEDRTKLELSKCQIPVLCMIPCECKLKDHHNKTQKCITWWQAKPQWRHTVFFVIYFPLVSLNVRGRAERIGTVFWCNVPIHGIFGYHHIICRLAQVK